MLRKGWAYLPGGGGLIGGEIRYFVFHKLVSSFKLWYKIRIIIQFQW